MTKERILTCQAKTHSLNAPHEQSSIRKATVDDAVVAYRIRNDAILHQCVSVYDSQDMEQWTCGELDPRFAGEFAHHGYVLLVNNAIVAVGMLDIKQAQVDAIFVDPKVMRLGLGQRMLGYIEALAKQHNLTQLSLQATLNAVAFYRKCGFVGDKQSVYQSPRGFNLACVPMLKNL
ncbi:GNAT family N-acetyltransferase [Shewanella intestini]|uniref:GNAT family N-acetyltransferase n=1 Tax=Shewanella intestini TaxID=2017544 RepID=A0ABS5I0V3_9GAMM|nr:MULTISPECIES: GNAT family N-acetyltransferase [Shewanella]MBR9727458.1 GNAT family N-acetyltransferase [Shewanella intestini]MRG35492.1 GNAT family N-acetyltransferase [Shewanella sp. XMDDZSB0408]